MKKLSLLLILLFSTIFTACELDGFLFNTESLDEYKLPGNSIPQDHLQEVSLNSGGNKIYGYWVESNGERPGITILYCHGNKHNIDEYWDRVMLMYELGVNIFIYDYRGYGKSEGKSSETGLYQDSDAALNYVMNEQNVPADSLCIYGYSLGNVASIYLAGQKVDPRCLIAESPFASANSLTQGSTVLDIPSQWLTTGSFDNAKQIQNINTRFLLIHGAQDDFVRYRDNGKVVYANAPEPKSMVLVQDANHTDIPDIMGYEAYLELVRNWIFDINSEN